VGEGRRHRNYFRQRQQEGVQPDSATFVGMLNACACVLALEEGRCAHEQITQSGCESMSFVGNSLIEMYAKCWSMEEICSTRCHHGMWSLEIPFLEDMPCMGMVRKLLNILNGCMKVYTQMISLLFFCHLVVMQVWWMKACTIFNDHGSCTISAKLEHYTCMVDLFGCAGHL